MKRLKPSAKAAEIAPSQPLRVNAMAVAVAAALSSPAALYAQNLPTGLQTVQGAVTVSTPTATSMSLNQTTQNAGMTAQTFSIGSGYRVDVLQPKTSSVMVMNVLGGNVSNIFGTLTATGKFFLVNPQGVVFGAGATVDVGGLVATTMPISYADATSGRYVFTNNGDSGSVEVQKGARITALNGYVGLFAPKVINEGIIVARMGQVALAAGNQVTLDMVGDGLIKVSVNESALNASVMNKGTIEADGGNVLLTARSANALLDTVINTDGIIRANTIANRNGTIVLDGGDRGIVSVGGTIEAKGSDAGTIGGTAKVLGQYVGLLDSAVVNVSGDAGGGTALIGGNVQGSGPEHNATVTYMGPSAQIRADAGSVGDGGKVVVWADNTTRALGSGNISARGGAQGGNGGFIETSGKRFLAIGGAADASAPSGNAGAWLLDPSNVTITGATANFDTTLNSPVPGTNTYSPVETDTAPNTATISAGTLQTALNAGTNVIVDTTSAGTAEAGDITVAASISKTSGADATLTLKADNSIFINSSVAISSSGGGNKLNVVLNADADASGAGAIVMNSLSSISSNGGNITLGGGASPSTLPAVGTAASKAGVSLLGGAILNAGAGNITIRGQGSAVASANNNYGVEISGGSQVTANGTITIAGTGGANGDLNHGVFVTGASSAITSASGSISVTGVGGNGTNDNHGVFVDNAGKIESTGSATVTVDGTGDGGHGVKVSVSGAAITSVDGDIIVTGAGAGGSGANGVLLQTGGSISSTGLATVTVDGSVTASGSSNNGVNVIGGSISSVTGDILVTGIGANGTTNNVGVLVASAGKIESTGTASVTVNGTGGNGSGDNNHGVFVDGTGAAISSASGNVSVTGTGGSGGVNDGVRVASDGSIATAGAGSITLTGTQGSGVGSFGIQTLTGSNVIGGGAHSGAVTLIADSMSLANVAISSSAGVVTLRQNTAGELINLGGADSLATLGLTNAELNTVTAPTLQIGDASSGNMTVSAAIAPAGVTTLDLRTGGSISQGAGFTITVNTLTGSAGTSVALSESNAISNLGAFTAGTGFALADVGGLSLTGNLSSTGGATSITTTGALALGANVDATGQTLSLSGIGVTQSAGKILSAGTTINGGAGAITLTSATNDFTGTVDANNTGASPIQITSANDITVGTIFSPGNAVTVTSAGGSILDDSLASAITGSSVTLNASAGSVGSASGAPAIDVATANLTVTANNNMHVASSLPLTNVNLTLNPAAGTNTYTLADGSGTYTLSNPAANQLLITALQRSGTNFSVSATNGDISVAESGIQAGSGSVTLQSTLGNILDSTPGADTNPNVTTTGTVTLTAPAGSIGTGADPADFDIAGTTSVVLTSGTGTFVGSDVSPANLTLVLNPAGTVVNTQFSGGGTTVNITESSGDVSINQISTGALTNNFDVNITASSGGILVGTNAINLPGTGSDVLLTSSLSGITLGSGAIVTNTGNITLTAATTITGPVGANSVTITTPSTGFLSLNSGTGGVSGAIGDGGGGPLMSAMVGNLLINSGGSGNVNIKNTGALTLTSFSKPGGGNLNIATASPLTIAANVILAGDIVLDAPEDAGAIAGDNLTVNTGITVQSTGGSVTLNAGDNVVLSGTAIVNGATGVFLNAGVADNDTFGLISQAAGGTILGPSLTTTSLEGATLIGTANAVSSFTATNTTSGNVQLVNTAAPLTITGISQAGGGTVAVNNTGAISITGTVSAGGGAGINLTSSSTISESVAGLISTTGTLTTSSAGGQTLNGSNAIGSFNGTNATSGNIALTDAGGVDITGISNAVGNVTLTNTGAISDTGAINTGLLTTSSAGGTVLDFGHTVTSFNATNITSGNVVLSDAGGVDITGISNAVGNVTLTNTGAISDTGAINTGLLTTSSAGGTVLDFGHTVTSFNATNITSGNVVLSDAGGVDITGISNAVGNVTLTNTGAISDTGAINTGLLTTSSAGGTVLDFGHTVTSFNATNITSGNVVLSDAGGVDITGISNAVGNVTLSNTGAISDTGAINTGLLTTSSAGGTVLDFGHTVTSFNATNITSGNVVLSDAGGVDITGISNAVGNVTLTNTGAISDTGAINTGLLTTSSAGGTVLDFGHTVTSFNATNITSGNIALTNTTGTLTVTGITQSAAGGTVTVDQTGNLDVANAVSAPGLVDLKTTGGYLDVNTGSGGVTGGGVKLTTVTSGSIFIGDPVAAGSGTATLVSADQMSSYNSGTVSGLNADLTAINGIGSGGNKLFTDVTNLKATNTFNGIEIINTGAGPVTLTNFGSGNAVTNTNGGLQLEVVNGSLNVSSPIVVGRKFNLFVDNGDLAINAAISGTGFGGGTSNLLASGAVTQANGTTIQTSGGSVANRQITVNSNFFGGGASGVTQNGTAQINTNGGDLNIADNGTGSITLTGGSASGGAITVTANAGSVAVNGALNGGSVSVTASGLGSNLTSSASGSITSTVGTVGLSAGKDVTLGATVSAATATTIDFAQSEAGTFSTIAGVTGTSVNINSGMAGSIFDFSGAPAITATLAGSGATDNLKGRNAVANSWTVNAPNAGSVGGLTFTGIGILTGGASGNTFDFTTGTASVVTVTGGAGADTIQNSTGAARTVVMNTANDGSIAPMITTGFTGIETYTGGSTDSLTAPAATTITVNGFNAGTVGAGMTFTGVNTLVADAGGTTFNFTTGTASVATVTGGAGADTIQNSTGAARTVVMNTANDGSIASMITTGFTGIETYTGGSTDSLTAPAATTITVNGFNAGTVGAGMTFTGVNTLVADAGGTTFNFTTGTASVATVTGGAGADTIQNSTGAARTVVMNTANDGSIASMITTGFTGIETYTGGSTDSLTAPAATTITVNGFNAGTVGAGMTFTGVNTLVADAGGTTFNFTTGTASVATVTGGAGADTIQNSTGAARTVVMNTANDGSIASMITTGFTGIETYTGGGTDSVTAPAGSALNVTAANTGNVGGGMGFTGVNTVIANAAGTTFNFTGAGSVAAVTGGAGTDTITATAGAYNTFNAATKGTFSFNGIPVTSIENITDSGAATVNMAGTTTGGVAGNVTTVGGTVTLGGGNQVGGSVNMNSAGTLNMGTAGTITGSANAGALSYAAYATPVTFNASNTSGGTTGIGTTYSGVTGVTGSGAGTDTVAGTGATYDTFTGTKGTFNAGGRALTSFENINDTGAGAVNMAGAGATGGVNGNVTLAGGSLTLGAGNNVGGNVNTGGGTLNMGTAGSVTGTVSTGTLSYASYATPVTFNVSTSTVTGGGIAGAVTGASTVIGSAGTDTITGTNVTWALTGANSGTGGGYNWSSFENLSDTGNASITGSGGSLAGALAVTGTSTLNGGIVTGGGQTYTGAVTLAGSTTLQSTGGGGITFGNTVNGTTSGAQNLIIATTGSVILGTGIGGGTPLGTLTVAGALPPFGDRNNVPPVASLAMTSITASSPTADSVILSTNTFSGTGTITTNSLLINGETSKAVDNSITLAVTDLTVTGPFNSLWQFGGNVAANSAAVPPGSGIGVCTTVNGCLTLTTSQSSGLQTASLAAANAAAQASSDAADIFGTDSVAQQIEYGFAGDVGTLPPIDHRLQGVGISVPDCFNESREGESCAK